MPEFFWKCVQQATCQTKAVADMSSYPLKTFLERGLKVTLNTDDPAIERTSLSREFKYMESLTGITKEQQKQLILNSVEAAFTSADRKKELRKQLFLKHMKKMKTTTLCYIENNDKYLMLHRIKKQMT